MESKILENQNVPAPREGVPFLRQLFHMLAWYAGVCIVLAIAVYVSWLVFMNSNTDVTVPAVLNKTADAARAELDNVQLQAHVLEEFSSEAAPGVVIRQLPEPGSRVRENRQVTVIVSKGPDLITIPDFRGLTFNDVLKTLQKDSGFSEGAALKIGNINRAFSDEIEKGRVISQSPLPGRRVEKDVRIDLLISEGEEPVYVFVPELVGETIETAEQAVLNANLKVEKIEQIDQSRADRIVLKQSPEPWTKVTEGTVVDLYFNSLQAAVSDKKTRHTIIPYTTPKYFGEKRVKLILYDAAGVHEIYDQRTAPAKKIFIPTTVVGEGRIKVYVDNRLKQMFQVNPE